MRSEIDDIRFLRESLENAIGLLSQCRSYLMILNPGGSGVLLIKEIEDFDKQLSERLGGKCST